MGYDSRTSISNGVSTGFNDTHSGGTASGAKTVDKDFSSEANLDERTQGLPSRTAARFRVAEFKSDVGKGLNKPFLERAKSIIDSFKPDDVMDAKVNLEALRGILLQLWNSAASSSQFHQDILATLESAMLTVESPNEGQLSVFREAIVDLENCVLTQAHVDVIRRLFIGEGFSPLALLSEIEDGDESNS